MFEIGVFVFILFAIGYWATLFVMGRREDVLHGQFVEADRHLVPAGAGASVSFLQPVSRPRKAGSVPAAMPAPVAPLVEPAAAWSESSPAPASARAATASSDTDAWESLLASIKLELKNASQI
jgi:hypothetical protein